MIEDSLGEMHGSEVSEWYRGRTIFITGGSGFMGKVLVEKLLRSCSLRKIYLLMRPKKGVDVAQRVDDMFSNELFDNLKKTQPEVLQKVVAVKGDIIMEGLGLSDEDEAKLHEVSVIFHAAATINFQEPLRVAVNMNMLGTKRVVSLAHKLPNLQALVHVSTAYGNCHLEEIHEQLYPAPIDPSRLIQLTEWLNDDILNELTPHLVHPRPNTYTYTKALAEHVLVNDGGDLPITIIRPTIVCGTWKEPTPGWVDNMFGFTGLMVGMGKGFLRSLCIKPGTKFDFIPVDIPINLMIVAAWNVAVRKFEPEGAVPIFCASSTSQKAIKLEDLTVFLKKTVWRYPLDSPLWYPDGSPTSSKFFHNLHVYLVNVIPAFIGDIVLRILGKKPIAMKLCNKMIRAINALEYFMLRDWTFSNENVRELWINLTPVDRQMFHFDISELDWQQYIDFYQIGCKKYLMKEDMSNLPAAKRNLRLLFWVHRLFQVGMIWAVYYFFGFNITNSVIHQVFHGMSSILSMAPILAAAEDVLDVPPS